MSCYSSFEESHFLGDWKSAIVVPVPKDGNKLEPEDNRPISLLPAHSKVADRLAYDQLYAYFEPLLSTFQSGFRAKHSTETALVEVVDFLSDCLARGHIGILMSFDLRKAFDTLNHEVLLGKLRLYGLSEAAVRGVDCIISGGPHHTNSPFLPMWRSNFGT